MRTWRTDEVFADGEGISVKMISANHHVCPHTHDFIEIIYIASGEGVERIDGVMHEVKRGDLLFVNFGETHSFLMSGMKYVNILIRPEFISDVLLGSEDILDVFALPQFASIPGEFTKSCIVSFSGDELLRVGETVNAMISEYSEKRPGYKTLLHGYTQVLIAMLIRKLKCNTEERDTVASRIEHYIDEHLGERLTLSDIAENCFYNPSYFSRKFKSIYGFYPKYPLL